MLIVVITKYRYTSRDYLGRLARLAQLLPGRRQLLLERFDAPGRLLVARGGRLARLPELLQHVPELLLRCLQPPAKLLGARARLQPRTQAAKYPITLRDSGVAASVECP